jgi:hypothetical protein
MRHLPWLALLLGLASAPATAQQVSGCSDDYGTNRCDPTVQAEVRAKFGVESAEAFAAAKTPLLRAFFVDGYGQEEPLISFVRRPGNEPEAIVTVVLPDRDKPIELRAVVPVALWEKLFDRAQSFDRALVPIPDQLCLHSWMATVEAVEVSQFAPREPRQKVGGACDQDAAMLLAFDLADAAIALMPACDAIGPTRQRNSVTRLASCARLEGDRAAAAQALNAYESENFGVVFGPEAANMLSLTIYDEAEFRWPGEAPVQGNREVATAWAKHFAADAISIDRLIGENADRVRIEAVIEQSGNAWSNIGTPGFDKSKLESTPSAPRTARATMIWTRENGFGFRLRSIAVEPFRTAASASSR